MIRDKILETIKKYNLITPEDIILVAVSGGPDSMCLLDNMIKLQQILKIKEIIVVHLNHMIREEAKEETEYVKDFCNKNKIRCFVKFEDIINEAKEQKVGTEEAGRRARYNFFEQIAKKVGATKIAIAHNKNDNVETVLMHMLRGSGISGLSGIKPYREGKYIRPLIKCSRDEIEEYCRKENINPKYDKSNNDNTYTRNRIRNELIPYLKKEFNPNIIETIDRLSDLILSEENFMQELTIENYNKILLEKNDNEIILNLKQFNLFNNIIKSRIILYTIKELFGTSKGIEKIHIDDIIKLCGNNIGNKYTMPNKNLKVLVKNKKIYFSKYLK